MEPKMPEELLVDRAAVKALRAAMKKWDMGDEYFKNVALGIRYALITLGLDEEAES